MQERLDAPVANYLDPMEDDGISRCMCHCPTEEYCTAA
jgi:hypothetical protein